MAEDTLGLISRAWVSIVGWELANRSCPTGMSSGPTRDGFLIVRADNDSTYERLYAIEREILHAINVIEMAGIIFKSLRVRVRVVQKSEEWVPAISVYERAVAHLAELYASGPEPVAYASAVTIVVAMFPEVDRVGLARDVMLRRIANSKAAACAQ